MGLIYPAENWILQQKTVRTALFNKGSAFINLAVTARFTQISRQV